MAKPKVDFTLKGDKELRAILKKMDYKDMQRAYKKALTDSVKPLVNETKKQLRLSSIKNVNKPYIGKNGKTYKSMLQGIRSSVDVRDPEDNYAKVHIMGEFRLKWFEKGTALRKTYKKGSRGRIRPYRFFRNAVDNKGRECRESLEQNIKKSIQKVWEKR
jgi:hypothetical protein